LGVVATNALELGIDIGSLDVAVLAAYPGTIASTWQRVGRAGRRQGTSAAVLVASSAPLDQFMVQNPDYFFGRSPEHGYVNPDNLFILLNHLKCAAFELPLREEEKFGSLDLRRLCQHLEEVGFLHHASDGWHWVSESYPADAISLRAISSDNFVVVDTTAEAQVIGEVDFSSALTTLHEKAIYIQDGQQYYVERLDYDDRKAYVHQVASEYFTDAISYTKIKVLEQFDSAPIGPASKNHGEVQVNTQVVGFKKIKFHTMENVGSGQLTLPEQEMHTTAFWLTLPHEFMERLPYGSTERMDGVNGLANALQAIATLLVMCDARDLGRAVGENDETRRQKAEGGKQNENSRIRDSGFGIREEQNHSGGEDKSKIQNLKSKIGGSEGKTEVLAFEPNIYLYDKYPGGVGFSEPLFRMSESLLEKTRKLIASCPCTSGCPSCVGPIGEVGEKGKEVAMEILQRLSAVSGQ
jgi:DEAD/DEAH box helicase domain-containing protein